MPKYNLPQRPLWPGATISVEGPLLHEPVDQPADQPLQYGLGKCIQVSPTQVVMMANRRVTGAAVVDFENGWDTLVFDDLSQVTEANARPTVSNTNETHPRTGQPLVMVHHLPNGGFVPLGAKLPDGRPHPHAGTGFGLAEVHGYPADNSVQSPHVAPDMHAYPVLYQYAFDGQAFKVTAIEPVARDQLLPGWWVFNRGLGPAIPDGEDMLFGLVAGRDDEQARAHAERLEQAGRKPYNSAMAPVGECYGSGLSRWRRGANGWRPVSYTPVPFAGPDMAFEPSLIRDGDGSLLLCMRGRGANVLPGELDCGLENTFEHFRVYRSTDNGQAWESVIHLPEMRAPSPVTINRTADGQVFLAANPYRPLQKDSRGRVIMKYRQRDQLWVWPVSDDRRSVGQPAPVLNCSETLGPPRDVHPEKHDNMWYADHPVSGVFRLGDGKLRTLMGFRVTDAATTSGGALAAPQAGAWLAEFHTSGPQQSPWGF